MLIPVKKTKEESDKVRLVYSHLQYFDVITTYSQKESSAALFEKKYKIPYLRKTKKGKIKNEKDEACLIFLPSQYY